MQVEYDLVRSGRRTIGMEIKDGRLLVRAPFFTSRRQIEAFITANSAWVTKALEKAERAKAVPKLTDAELKALHKEAKRVIPERVALYAPLVGVTPGRITIRCQKTKWGSCSRKGNLNFNCLLLLMPEEVLDSVVVHELCHLKHMDHSAAFYREVFRVFPAYKIWNGYLKEHAAEIMAKAN